MIRFEDLVEKVRAYSPDADLELLRRAYVFSAFEHKGQVRHSGEPYMVHPLEVADFLAELKLDVVTVAAGLLHDVVEDTLTTIERITEVFGPEVAHVVEGVTKISAIPFSSSEERQAENFRKMLLAMVDDIRVTLVKLADRLHNMRTLHHLPEERRVKIATETLDIYAPIANRLGMSKVKNELEELSFKYLEPRFYESLRSRVEGRRRATEGVMEELRKTLVAKLEDAQVPIVHIDGRIKRLYSIAQKLKKQKIELEQVYDFVALRVVTKSVRDCYAALGIIHNTWSPVPGRIKDFIAMPRPNGYQSLHTSVISERGTPFEVQIRTEEMHEQAEEGIAAHWKYKEGRVGDQRDERYFQWLRQLLEWQQEVRDPQEFIHSLKIDLYPEEVYTFTPKGEVKALPRGATPVDFAYAIHTDVGHKCVGARVNGKMVPLRTRLKNGDIVEIVTAAGHGPKPVFQNESGRA
jgi:GTP pyrophosphokinase